MKRQDLIISIFIGIVLGILGVITGVANNFLSPQLADAESPVDLALSTMLTSQTKWRSVQGEAKFVWYSENGSTQTYINKFSLSQPYMVYVEVIDQTGLGVDGIWISDGKNIYDLNKDTRVYTQTAFRGAMKDTSNLPSSLSDVKQNNNTVKFYPLSTIINAPIREYLFPSWFSQGRNGDKYSIEKEGTFLGRKVWVIHLHTIYNDDDIAWVDKATGIILKFDQKMNGKKFLEMMFTFFSLNTKINPEIFKVPQAYSLAPN